MNTVGDDFEMRRTVWDGRIPVELTIDSSESLHCSHQSSFMMLPRVGYFPVYMDKALRILTGDEVGEEELTNAWLLHNGHALKWHYPIGVLFDMLHSKGSSLPWTITIRLKDFPDELIRCRSRDTLKFSFLQSLKEASQLKHRHNIASNMTKEEHNKLFDSLCNDRFNDFWSINEKLMHAESSEVENEFVNIPIKFYEATFPFRQLLIPSKRQKDGANIDVLLVDALRMAFPEEGEEKYEAISHSISLPMESSVLWLARNLSYPDNFVHIVLIRK